MIGHRGACPSIRCAPAARWRESRVGGSKLHGRTGGNGCRSVSGQTGREYSAPAAARARTRLGYRLGISGAVSARPDRTDRLPVRVGNPAQLSGQAGGQPGRLGRLLELPGAVYRSRSEWPVLAVGARHGAVHRWLPIAASSSSDVDGAAAQRAVPRPNIRPRAASSCRGPSRA